MGKKYMYDFLKKHLENNTYGENLYVEKDIENGYIIAIKAPHQRGFRKKNKENAYQVFIDYAVYVDNGNLKPETNEQYTDCMQNFFNAFKNCRTFSVGKATKIKNITSYEVIEKKSYKYFLFPCEEKKKPLWPVRLPFNVATDQTGHEPNFSVKMPECHCNNLEFEKISKPMAIKNEFGTTANNLTCFITLVISGRVVQEPPIFEEIKRNVSHDLEYVETEAMRENFSEEKNELTVESPLSIASDDEVQESPLSGENPDEILNDLMDIISKDSFSETNLEHDINNKEVKAIAQYLSNAENENVNTNWNITDLIDTDRAMLESPNSEQMLEIDFNVDHVLME